MAVKRALYSEISQGYDDRKDLEDERARTDSTHRVEVAERAQALEAGEGRTLEDAKRRVDARLAALRLQKPGVDDKELLRELLAEGVKNMALTEDVIKDAACQRDSVRKEIAEDTQATSRVLQERDELKARLVGAANAGRCRSCRLPMLKPFLLANCRHSFCEDCTVVLLSTTRTCPRCQKEMKGAPTQNYAVRDMMRAVMGMEDADMPQADVRRRHHADQLTLALNKRGPEWPSASDVEVLYAMERDLLVAKHDAAVLGTRLKDVLSKKEDVASALATATRERDALKNQVEQAEQALECSICLERAARPWAMADCGHTFCQRHMKWLLRKRDACPLCNKRIETPPVVNGAAKDASWEIAGKPGDECPGTDWAGVMVAFLSG
ncbi:hypothetical protein AURDEDRAFT_177838 [Auricularia subglabra TFB-10046 SS5]|uniref:RING-type domain-containing protein n=1 Tax=Auricularia subglabra (strain TFB-10046 / SS5) TaxID=717982 RepID=J0CS42_AURST|nr:hypothetical protein AURDEDRAFT_177838 [Auricularia subglabra TFB-10046 SS5]